MQDRGPMDIIHIQHIGEKSRSHQRIIFGPTDDGRRFGMPRSGNTSQPIEQMVTRSFQNRIFRFTA